MTQIRFRNCKIKDYLINKVAITEDEKKKKKERREVEKKNLFFALSNTHYREVQK